MSKRKDTLYHKAKQAGFRSRASFKIIELQEKFGMLREGDLVLEIGSSPGGWSQIIGETTGNTVIALDIKRMDPVPGVVFIRANLFSDRIEDQIGEALAETGNEGFNAIVSDAMVNTSGDRNIDHSSSYLLCRKVIELADRFLLPGGNLVVKQFHGDLTPRFIKEWGRKYRAAKKTGLSSTRTGSSEIYIIFFGRKGD